MRQTSLIFALTLTVGVHCAKALDGTLQQQANAALRRCTAYLTQKVAYHGGFAGSYLADLSDQWGETHCLRCQNWIQPPGSPSTGQAFLSAWKATGDPLYLEAARKCAEALAWGQLECGGWDYIVDFSKRGERSWRYQHNRDSSDRALKRGRNRGTFDDNTSQAAIRLLMAVDAALEQKDKTIHEAAMAGIEWVLRAQYPHGGFPQWYPLFPHGYHNFTTYNDFNMAHIMELLQAAFEQYGDERCHKALLKLGQFFIKSQMPEPQPVWCQQYDSDLKPAWARRFEPPAVTGGESSGVLRSLVRMAVITGDEKYLKPIPAALAWYKRSRLPDGKWARFYELKTNRPLYFTSDSRTTYRLTYSNKDAPDHYCFETSGWYPTRVERDYATIKKQGLAAYRNRLKTKELTTAKRRAKATSMEPSIRKALANQTPEGVWLTLSNDRKLIDMRTVQRQMRQLAEYLRLANGR